MIFTIFSSFHTLDNSCSAEDEDFEEGLKGVGVQTQVPIVLSARLKFSNGLESYRLGNNIIQSQSDEQKHLIQVSGLWDRA